MRFSSSTSSCLAAYSPEARGRSERMFGTLQKRLPQELRLAGITDMAGANRFLKELFLPQHNARFATPAGDQGSAFVPFTGTLDDILCIHEERTVSNDNTVRYKRAQIAATGTSRPGSASTNPVDRDVWRDDGQPIQPARPVTPSTRPTGALWTSGQPRRA